MASTLPAWSPARRFGVLREECDLIGGHAALYYFLLLIHARLRSDLDLGLPSHVSQRMKMLWITLSDQERSADARNRIGKCHAVTARRAYKHARADHIDAVGL